MLLHNAQLGSNVTLFVMDDLSSFTVTKQAQSAVH